MLIYRVVTFFLRPVFICRYLPERQKFILLTSSFSLRHAIPPGEFGLSVVRRQALIHVCVLKVRLLRERLHQVRLTK
jgi:hypothetical protein